MTDSERTWPADWDLRRAGVDCRICAQGRPERTAGGVRFYSGRFADGYLRTSAPLPGYSTVIWRGRHVADPAEMTTDEAAGYWSDVLAVARLLNAVFSPAQMNYLIFGNHVPHVHAYLLPRYVDDPSPGLPLQPFTEHRVPDEVLAEQLERLNSVREDD